MSAVSLELLSHKNLNLHHITAHLVYRPISVGMVPAKESDAMVLVRPMDDATRGE